MFYETKDSKVLGSEPYLRSLNNPTQRTKEAISRFKNTIRGIYSLLATGGRRPPTDAPYIFVVKFNPKPGREQEVIQWFEEAHLQELCSIRGVYRGRLYGIDSEVSNIRTEERKIHGAGPGQQRYLALYEIGSLEIFSDRNWQEMQLGKDAQRREMLRGLQDVHQEAFWIDFTLYAPESN